MKLPILIRLTFHQKTYPSFRDTPVQICQDHQITTLALDLLFKLAAYMRNLNLQLPDS